MFDHTWIQENLAAYLAGGLEPAERERLEQHTAECASCAAALANARALDATLFDLFVEVRPSPSLEDRVIQTLRTRPAGGWRLSPPGWLVVAAAALVLIGLTGALANQILGNGRAAPSEAARIPPVLMLDSEIAQHTRTGEDVVAKLAEESRQRALERLGETGEAGKRDEDIDRYSHKLPTPAGSAPERVHLQTLLDGKPTAPEPSAGSAPERGTDLDTRDKGARKDSLGGLSTPTQTKGEVKREFVPQFQADPTDKQPNFGFQPNKMLDQQTEVAAARTLAENHLQRKGWELGLELRRQLEDRKEEKQKKDANFVADNRNGKEVLESKPSEQPNPRKVIRTGELEYEVQSFDAAVATITRLVKNIKGGFIATVNSDKLANGKVRGSVVVRVPPENLDELIQELRANLGKSGELKNQRIGSLDITKQYTDLESELKAARAMEERLLQIIKTGKGEIKDLVAAEKELGNWRTRIEKIEGELRYYANQVALSTLTIHLYEKEITAPFAVIEREQVHMGIEVEDVDQALQAAQKAVREAKGRITRAELKQPSQGQFSALLDFEVAPDAAGPLRDRLKQLGTVARFDISRLEETQGGIPPSSSLIIEGSEGGTKVKRADTRFHVHFYNLTDVPPRETIFLNLACSDVETAMKTLLARVDKAAGRVLSSNLTSTHGAQTQGDLQFQVKTTLADAVLEDIKSAGEVMALQVRETTNVETTRKKRGFHVKLWTLEATTARETDELQLACTDVAASYRLVQEAVLKVKGRVHNAQLNEQDRRNVTATLDFEVRRADEDAVRAALLKAGVVYTRKVSRAAEAENVVDSKVRWQVTFLNQATIPPRETYTFGIEVADVDQTTAMLSALSGKHEGRTVEANISRERNGRVTGKLIYDVPIAEVRDLLDALKSAGIVRVQQIVKHPEVPDSSLAVARLDVTLSNAELIVPSDKGIVPSVRRGLSDSFTVLLWSLRILILGLCVLLPWALVIWAISQLIVRLRRRIVTRSA